MELTEDEKIDIIEIGAVERQLEIEAQAQYTAYHLAKILRKMMKGRRK